MSTTRLVLREKKDGVLLPLGDVLRRLEMIGVEYWALHDVEGFQGAPWGIALVDFEKLTRVLQGGLCLTNADLLDLGDSGIQIVNGDFEALSLGMADAQLGVSGARESGPLLRLSCIDGGQWEIHTDLPSVVAALEKAGLRRD